MAKIIEKIIEPNHIEIGSTFKFKVKVIEYITYSEIKNLTVEQLKQYRTSELKGEIL
ncbi:MAG: hypothetical protein ACI4VC_04205 [Clostridia bacterium]